MGWETKNGHQYYVVHRKQFGQMKPVYGGSGEAGRLAEQKVHQERTAAIAKRDKHVEFNRQYKEYEAMVKEYMAADMVKMGYVYTEYRHWVLASKIRGPRGPYNRKN